MMWLTRGARALGAATALLAGTAPLRAQAAPPAAPVAAPRVITFEEAVRIGLERNADLRVARNSSALGDVDVRQARLQFLPSVNLSTSGAQNYGRNFSEAEGGIINRTTQSFSTGLSSSVVLFNGGANVANLREARLSQDAGELDLERARQTVVFTVASDFLALVQQREQLRVQRENLAAAEALEGQIQAFVDAGTRSIADLYAQQATVASARLAVVQAERARQLAEVAVMQTLQLDPRGEYDFVAPALDTATAAASRPSLDSLLARAFAQRPDLDAQAARQEAAEQGIRAARAGIWPSLSLSAGYNTNYTSASDFGFTDQLDQRRGGSVGIGLSFPVFDRGNVSAASQRARIAADNARIALETRRQEVGLQVRSAWLDLQSAQAQYQAAEAQRRAAELALQTSQERYQVGAATLVELQQARATRVQAESALVTARYNLLFQRTQVDYYVGELDPAAATVGR
jgi:outer membrane protein